MYLAGGELYFPGTIWKKTNDSRKTILERQHAQHTARICIASRQHGVPRRVRTRLALPHRSRDDLVRAGARSPATRFGARCIGPPPNAVHGWHGGTIDRGSRDEIRRIQRVIEARFMRKFGVFLCNFMKV